MITLETKLKLMNENRRLRVIRQEHLDEIKSLIERYRTDMTVTGIVVKGEGHYTPQAKRTMLSTVIVANRENDWKIVPYLSDARRPFRRNERVTIVRVREA